MKQHALLKRDNKPVKLTHISPRKSTNWIIKIRSRINRIISRKKTIKNDSQKKIGFKTYQYQTNKIKSWTLRELRIEVLYGKITDKCKQKEIFSFRYIKVRRFQSAFNFKTEKYHNMKYYCIMYYKCIAKVQLHNINFFSDYLMFSHINTTMNSLITMTCDHIVFNLDKKRFDEMSNACILVDPNKFIQLLSVVYRLKKSVLVSKVFLGWTEFVKEISYRFHWKTIIIDHIVSR